MEEEEVMSTTSYQIVPRPHPHTFMLLEERLQQLRPFLFVAFLRNVAWKFR